VPNNLKKYLGEQIKKIYTLGQITVFINCDHKHVDRSKKGENF